ncbi:BolA domain UV induced protein Uvi31 [Elasticomyces elasticus]|nr:BolA domain UV induced protein Uvi31 [Elasticomyces elasticus]
MALSKTPMEDAMRQKITDTLAPTSFEVFNDSHLHSHHKAMKDTTSQETHFRVFITSSAFEKKMQPARHRMVYTLLKDELAAQDGIHALQLRTRTPEEEEKVKAKEAT